jgi:hypothetical protein
MLPLLSLSKDTVREFGMASVARTLCWVHFRLEDLPEGVVTAVRVCDRHFLEGHVENGDHNDH